MKAIVKTKNKGTLNLRATPNGVILGQIPNDTELDVDIEGEWAYTEYNNHKGYVKISFLSFPGVIDKTALELIYAKLKETLKTIEEVLKE